jgi:hypothetical protein
MNFARPPYAKQRGLSMIGFLFVAVVLVFAAMLAMKLVPAYIEFFSVKEILLSMGQQADFKSMSNNEIRSNFSKKVAAGYTTAVKAEDLSIDRSSGAPVVSADYQFRTKLVGNVSLIVDFSASSDPDAAPPEIE